MHVLFYIEPHPIRRSFTGFVGTVEKFFAAALAAQPAGHTLSLYGNAATLAALPGLQQHHLPPTDEEQKVFALHYADDWDGKGIADWQALMAGEGGISDDYIALLRAVHARAPFDLVVYWGTNGAVRAFSQQQGIPAIAMELGCTRPPYLDSVVMDPAGVNGDSIYTRLSNAELQTIVGNAAPVPFLPLRKTRRAENIRAQAKARPIALLPLQLYDDANLLRFSRYASMLDFVQDVVPPLIDAGYFVVVKDHPAAYTRPSGTKKSREVADYLRAFTHCHWISDRQPTENLSLFAIADAVVTVNSSTGFEASLHGIPVIVMGEACYKLSGIFPTLAELLGGAFDRSAYQQRLHALHAFFFAAVLRPRAIATDVQAFIAHLIETARLHRMHPDAASFARAAYQSFAATAPQRMPAPSPVPRGLKAWVVAHPAVLRCVLPLWQRLR